MIGKYKEYFWYANEDGGISFIGIVMPDILYFMTETNNYTFDMKWKYDKNKADEFYKTIKILEYQN